MKDLKTTITITVLEAIKKLSISCDGAIAKDQVGFNKPDSGLNKFAHYNELTKEQQEEFLFVLQKYKKQLGVDEITIINAINNKREIEANQAKISRKVIKKSFRLEGCIAIINFVYNSEIISWVKEISGRKFNYDTRAWSITITDRNIKEFIKFLNHWYFEFNEVELKKVASKNITNPFNRVVLNGDKFNIAFDYNVNLLGEVKTIPNRKFNPKTKNWEIPIGLKSFKDVVSFIKNHEEFFIGEGVKDTLNRLFLENKKQSEQLKENVSLSDALKASPDFKIKEGLGGVLRNFQEAGVEYIIKNKKVILGDEMGTGKTIQALAAVYHTNSYPCLVVCPNTIKYNWERELKKWIPGVTTQILESKDISIDKVNFIITNYNTIVKHQGIIQKIGLKTIIVDESHYCKNFKSKRTKAIKFLASRSRLELLIELSGTVTTNRPQELISQLDILGKLENFGGFWEFATKYCRAHRTRFGLDMSGSANLEELHQKLRANCYIRRNKKDVLKELPDMQVQLIEVDITNRAEYNRAKEDLINYLRNEVSISQDFLESISELDEEEQKQAKKDWHDKKAHSAAQAEHLVRINTLKQLVGEGKMKASIEFISNIIQDEKLVVFTTHKKMANEISIHFKCNKIDGSVKAIDRQRFVDDFQDNLSTKLIVINIAAGREGLTLTAASKLVFLEQGWTPAEMDQAAARIHRIGQKNIANIYNLLGKSTIDIDIYDLIAKKRKVIEAINAGQSSTNEVKIMSELIKKLLKS